MQKPLWVFGYGSLIWNPGFAVAQSCVARLDGWHRSFCMRSIHHRGTSAAPGLVLALDRAQGAVCAGVAFRVADGEEEAAIAYLRARELVSSAYLEDWLPLQIGAQTVTALCYVIDPAHDQYCGGLPLAVQADIIATAVGGRGPNAEYLFNTADHLAHLGIADPDLEWLCAQLRGSARNGAQAKVK
jgi:cation transport protein ChaC